MNNEYDLSFTVTKITESDGKVTLTREVLVGDKKLSPKWTIVGIVLCTLLSLVWALVLCLILVVPDLILKLAGAKGFIHLRTEKSSENSTLEHSDHATSTFYTHSDGRYFRIGILDCLEAR